MESTQTKAQETKKSNPEKVRIADVQMHRPKTPKKTPDFIGWSKKGKGATCS